jgi:hypothetical protein
VGDKEHIHHLAVTGIEIDEAASPPDLRTKDVPDIFNAATDVTSLPGMLGASQMLEETSEDVRNTTEMAATLMATVVGRPTRIHDSLWQTVRRHAMAQIKDKNTLFKFVKAVEKEFRKQDNAIQVLMYRRHYSKRSVDEYLQKRPPPEAHPRDVSVLPQPSPSDHGTGLQTLDVGRRPSQGHVGLSFHPPAAAPTTRPVPKDAGPPDLRILEGR